MCAAFCVVNLLSEGPLFSFSPNPASVDIVVTVAELLSSNASVVSPAIPSLELNSIFSSLLNASSNVPILKSPASVVPCAYTLPGNVLT